MQTTQKQYVVLEKTVADALLKQLATAVSHLAQAQVVVFQDPVTTKDELQKETVATKVTPKRVRGTKGTVGQTVNA